MLGYKIKYVETNQHFNNIVCTCILKATEATDSVKYCAKCLSRVTLSADILTYHKFLLPTKSKGRFLTTTIVRYFVASGPSANLALSSNDVRCKCKKQDYLIDDANIISDISISDPDSDSDYQIIRL